MFDDDYLREFYELGRAIETGQRDRAMSNASALFDEPDRPLKKNGDTCLHIAAESGHSEMFMLLWKQITTNPNTKNLNGELPFHYACREGCLEIVKICLQDAKGNIDQKTPDGWTGLFYAVFNNQIPVVAFLLSKKAHINGLDKYNRTPLHWAAKYGFVEALILLVEHGGDLDFKDKEGITPLKIMKGWEEEDLQARVDEIVQSSKRRREKKATTILKRE